MKQEKDFLSRFHANKVSILLSFFFLAVFVTGVFYSISASAVLLTARDSVLVPIGGNTWRSEKGSDGGSITEDGISQWSDKGIFFTSYVRFARTGSLKVWIELNVPEGKSTIQLSIAGKSTSIVVSGKKMKTYYVGQWEIKDTGYVAIRMKGISKTGNVFANIQNLLLKGQAVNNRMAFVKNNDGNFFYWGRRGPSVHLNYAVPQNIHAEWFYNEVTVPQGNDITGSYFMADGFGEGYFGMQVNGPSTRHILFSVWSPFKTDHPNEIPDSQKIVLLDKGDGVHAGEFGNEGSGGQSYLNYMWKAGNTYKFLLHGVPDGSDHTIYTAYFYAPEQGKWRLIASFKRPKTNTYLTHLYSFLENFSPDQGDKKRKVLFANQWVRTDQGRWISLDRIRFTTDNTGRKGYRMDYAGGLDHEKFFLQNCGFFSRYTPVDTWFEKPAGGTPPQIDFNKLPGDKNER